jgi:hypothetical protein
MVKAIFIVSMSQLNVGMGIQAITIAALREEVLNTAIRIIKISFCGVLLDYVITGQLSSSDVKSLMMIISAEHTINF